jgi:uncharacterized OsmC-like protein
MNRITIHHHEDVRFTAHVGRHEVAIDLPHSHGGQDSGMAPPQLFVAALGACAGVYAADYCDSQGLDYRGMRLDVDWDVRERPRRIGHVRVRVELPHDALSPAQLEGLRASVVDCLLHNTLVHPPQLDVDVVPPASAGIASAAAFACDSGACCRPLR